MTFLCVILIACAVGTFGARHTDIDFNRIERLPEEIPFKSLRQSILQSNQIRTSNDYDDHSGRYAIARAPLPPANDVPPTNAQELSIQVYQPREDPRLFYQSNAYIKDYGSQNVNKEVTYVYPGNNVVRTSEKNVGQFSRIREDTSDSPKDFNMCVICPHDRTLVPKAASGKVMLQSPRLHLCSGRKVPRGVQFVHMYGPKFGSLLEHGSHMIIGQIVSQNKNLQLCKMQVHVVAQGCVTPKYLKVHCWDHNKRCNFTCRNSNLELSGPTLQICGDNLKWEGALPVCKGMKLIRRVLKKGAIPTVFTWSQPEISKHYQRRKKVGRVEKSQQLNSVIVDIPEEVIADEIQACKSSVADDLSYAVEVEVICVTVSSTSHSLPTREAGTQKNYQFFSIDTFNHNDKAIEFYTGMESYNKFLYVFSTLCPEVHSVTYRWSKVSNLRMEDQLFLTLIKLRRNKLDFELGLLFDISAKTVSNIFVSWIHFIHQMWTTRCKRQTVECGNLLDKCGQRDSIINIPAFLKGRNQLPGTNVMNDQKLSSKHMHFKHLTGQIKTFRFLQRTVHKRNKYAKLMSKIYFVCQMLCNFKKRKV